MSEQNYGNCQEGETKAKKDKKISERNLTKNFRELLEVTRSRNTTTCIKTLRMGIDMVKQKKVFQKNV